MQKARVFAPPSYPALQGVKLARKGGHDQDTTTKKWSSEATEKFQKHIDRYWIPFCEEAIRMFFVLGFVPWHLRRLQSTGDLVPEVIPLGTFDWCVSKPTGNSAQTERLFCLFFELSTACPPPKHRMPPAACAGS